MSDGTVSSQRSAAGALAVLTTTPATQAEIPALPPGTRIHQYEIIKLLGEGGMGRVFLARDLKLGRRVAIKLLQARQPEQTEVLLAEARATASCRHENIIVIYEVGEHAGIPYMVLEYLDGQPLTALLRSEGRLPYMRAVEITCSIVRALACAHAAGIVHRDLKPDNVLITDAGTVKVLDFGIAKVMQPSPPELAIHRGCATGATSRTDAAPGARGSDGAVVGTLEYMSPEQWGAGGAIDHQSDLWACGILLHEMVCGRRPLPPARLLSTMALELPMPSMAEAAPPSAPGELIRLVDRCLHKHKERRWQSAGALLAALEALLPRPRTFELPHDASPYAGLAAFQERDAAKFFGRTGEIAAVLTRLRDRPLLAVTGSSGVGKSSFVRAGVVPALKRSGETWDAIVIRPGRRPLEALAAVVRPEGHDEGRGAAAGADDETAARQQLVGKLRREPGHLGYALRLRARSSGRRVLLFVDQLEELYTQVSDPAERAAFTAALAAVADDATSPLRVVLSIRSDFLGRLAEDPWLAAELGRGLFFLGPPSREALREAIASPAELAGFAIERPEIVDDMLGHLEATPGALPLLQFAVAKLWELRDEARRLLTHRSYAEMGGVAGALASHADRVVGDLGPLRAPLARAILLRLVTAERTRAVVPLAELRALSPEAGAVERLVEQLVAARLLVVQTPEGGGGTSVEIVHESLVHAWPTLRRWLDEAQDDVALVEQLRAAARQWDARGRDRDLLWRGDALADYERWRRRHTASLTPLEAAFGAASVAEVARGRRIRRAIWFGALGAAAAIMLVLWRANVAANRAKHQSDRLLRNSYFEQGRRHFLEGDPLGALPLLATAYRMGATNAAARLLIEEATRPLRARLFALEGHTDEVLDVEYSPDGEWLATASADHTARLWDAETGALHATLQHKGQAGSVRFSADSRRLVSGGRDYTRVWDVKTGRELATLPGSGDGDLLQISPDASLLLIASPTYCRIRLWRIPTGALAGELPVDECIGSPRMTAAFCEDGSCIVGWSTLSPRAAKVVVWDSSTLARRAERRVPDVEVTTASSRDGSMIALGSAAGDLVILRDGEEPIVERRVHDGTRFDITVSSDGATIATTGIDRRSQLWSAAGEHLGTLTGAPQAALRFMPARDRVVTIYENTAHVWSASGMLLGELAGHTSRIGAVALRPDGERLATGSRDHSVIVWELERAQEFRPLISAPHGITGVLSFAPDGSQLAVVRAGQAATGDSLDILDIQSGTTICTLSGVHRLADDRMTRIDRVGSLTPRFTPERGAVNEIWSSPESTRPSDCWAAMVSARAGPRAAIVDERVIYIYRDGTLEARFEGYPGELVKVGIDGDVVYAITEEPSSVVVDTIGVPGQRRDFRAAERITDARIVRGPDELILAAGRSVYVWDLATRRLARKLDSAVSVRATKTSPDGATIIGIGGRRPLVWDRASGRRLRPLDNHEDAVTDGDFLNDQLFIATSNGTAFVWDVISGRVLLKLRDVEQIAVADDRQSVALVGKNGVRIWSPRAPAPDLEALKAFEPR